MDNTSTLKLNPKLYSLDLVYVAASLLLEDAYFLLDGDPNSEIIVSISAKSSSKKTSEELKQDFLNQLIQQTTYKIIGERSKGVKEILLQKALFSNMAEPPVSKNGSKNKTE